MQGAGDFKVSLDVGFNFVLWGCGFDSEASASIKTPLT